jgi:hypothetical protein
MQEACAHLRALLGFIIALALARRIMTTRSCMPFRVTGEEQADRVTGLT